MEEYPHNVMDLEKQFSTEESCKDYLFRLRWPNGFVCPLCQAKGSWQATRGRFVCCTCVHQVVSLLKRWLLGTHQGGIGHAHLDYYLDEFTFRFNRRNSKSRGKLLYRLLQQTVQVDPVTYAQMIGGKIDENLPF